MRHLQDLEATLPLWLYNLVRFQALKLSNESFPYPEHDEYDPEALFRHCFSIFIPSEATGDPVDVILRFQPNWATYLSENRWHSSQTGPVTTADGWIEVQFHLYIDILLVRWVRGFGNEVQIIAPERLKKWVQTKLDPEQG